MPPITKKKNLRKGFKTWADKQAVNYRRELDLNPTEPLCAFVLSEHLEIPIFVPSDVQGLSSEKIDMLMGHHKDKWSAATIPVEDRYIIIHNPSHSEYRQQSNLMHELAHVICNHKIPNETKILGLSGFLRNHNQEHENEANWLGGCLQLPRAALMWAGRRNMNITDISDYYKASESMVKYRMNISGVKRQLNYNTH